MPRILRNIILVAWLATSSARAEDTTSSLRLTVPPAVNAVVGSEIAIYFENLILTQKPGDYRFKVRADGGAVDFGTVDKRRWTFTPTAEHVGNKGLAISVHDATSQQLDIRTTELRVAPADAGQGRDVSLLIVGDSLTHATRYPNDLAKRLSGPGHPKVTFLGTHRPAGALDGVAHEGYGGWTWQRFNTLYTATPDPNIKTKQSSPFVFPSDDGKPALDVARYVREQCGGKSPDVVFFLLGINDCFSAKADDPAALDAHIDRVLKEADTLLYAFRKAAPNADVALGLTTPGNVREEAFVANYKGSYSQWGWKRIQHRLVEKELKHFGQREKARIFLVPTELALDPVDGYPDNNAVHPNEKGYTQIAGAIHAWLMNRWHETQSP